MFENSGQTAALKSVKACLNAALEKKYGTSKHANDILKAHGLHKDYFDFIANTENIMSENIADVSIDTNANKNEKTISGIFSEAINPVSKLVGYRYLYRTLKDLHGKEEAQRLMGEMYDYSLALSDSSKILLPYCFSLDASKLVLEGRKFGQLYSRPPKTLSSYIGALNETMHQLSNHTAGALAVGSLWFDIAHVLLFRENKTLDDLKTNKTFRKYIENSLQSFVHSMNSLSRNAVESPFSNISIFDRIKLQTFLSDDEMGWYFDDIHGKDIPRETIIEFILELQEIFMNFFDHGDPLCGGKPYRFPVVTLNLSKDESDKKNIKILDEDFIEKISRHEIYRYNILVSEGTKVASCCRLLSDKEMFELGGQVNSFGGSGLSLGSHRVLTINFNRIALEAESYNDYIVRLNSRIEDAATILMGHRQLMKNMMDSGLQPFMNNGWLKLDRMFSTLGVIGIVEAQQTVKQRFGINEIDVIGESLGVINSRATELSMKYSNVFNIEQIPGESMAVKLCQIDKILYPHLVTQELYANQFVPLWEDASVWDRMDADGKYNKMYTGGGIVHFNLGEKVTPQQAKKLIDYAAISGCEHFALNSVYSECENEHTHFGDMEKCPECGGQVVEHFTRVIGFFTPVSSWNKTRRVWEFPKRKFTAVE